jgi:regulator of protease activity HflC (stomatin/prohibitin superfamily)
MDELTKTLVSYAGILAAVILLWCLIGYPKWRVWAAHQAGLADLQFAKNEQQIQVSAAQGRLDAADLNKQAAVIEAQAVALQIKEIGEQLTKHDLYLRWQWIKMMEEIDTNNSVIYVPTEANLPILEASRLRP